ncbi:Hypothetical protein NTJ_02705 [Nesidiocoris tenuis]|uniref:Uncharacterized protein n=1 Tax=Nesidiocoris tenuis TaxID=355587 RepID=A0ABN7ACY8_9HEMI|nr:Hypothetical protein NTJ_02705 [Nesidiocoris tenuis]
MMNTQNVQWNFGLTSVRSGNDGGGVWMTLIRRYLRERCHIRRYYDGSRPAASGQLISGVGMTAHDWRLLGNLIRRYYDSKRPASMDTLIRRYYDG